MNERKNFSTKRITIRPANIELEKIMKFETKFNLNDNAWYMKDNKPTEVIISAINIFYVNTNQDKISYSARDVVNPETWIDHQHLFEHKLFKSKNGLLESLFSGGSKDQTVCKGKNCSAINGINHSPECIEEQDIAATPELFPSTADALSKLSVK